MAHYEVRSLRPSDFELLMNLEEVVFQGMGEKTLGCYYVRLCCDFFADSCLIAFADGVPAGYVLCFMKDREAYCTTLAIVPEYQGTMVTKRLLRAFLESIMYNVDTCFFTVKEDNLAARALHRTLGAVDVETRPDFYAPGDDRIVSKIDRATFERLRPRYERLGLLEVSRENRTMRECA